jgi:hypothetical protein
MSVFAPPFEVAWGPQHGGRCGGRAPEVPVEVIGGADGTAEKKNATPVALGRPSLAAGPDGEGRGLPHQSGET